MVALLQSNIVRINNALVADEIAVLELERRGRSKKFHKVACSEAVSDIVRS